MFTVDEGSLHLDLEPLPQMASATESRQAAPTVRDPPAPVRQSPVFAAAQRGNKRLAVLEFQGRNLDQDILMTFSDTVRGGALQGLDGRGVSVMTRENMLVLLRDMGKKECGEGDCEVETARNIGADYVISGKVVRMEQIYVVTLKMHETQGGSLIGTDTVEGASQVELLRSLGERARKVTTSAFVSLPFQGKTRSLNGVRQFIVGAQTSCLKVMTWRASWLQSSLSSTPAMDAVKAAVASVADLCTVASRYKKNSVAQGPPLVYLS